jgi:hypothetical protein
VVAVGLLVSSVTWEFYVVWLLPLFLVIFLAPSRVMPGDRGQRLVVLVTLALCYVALNYPGDHYLFDVNSVFYKPEWVPGIVVEDIVDLYPLPPDTGRHLEVVPVLRLAALSLTALLLVATVVEARQRSDGG